MKTKLVVGLGNIGPKYTYNRHNIGFIVIDYILNKNNYIKLKFKNGDLYLINLSFIRLYLLKPNTFMNLSGIAVQSVIHKYNINLEDIMVICDDINISFGKFKIKAKGSHGGHNGLRDICNRIGNAYSRLRFGIEDKRRKDDLAKFVLSNFSDDENIVINELLDKIYDSIFYFLEFGINNAMNKYN